MSIYHKLEFVSPEPLFAEIKETLRSYFDSGAIDDLLFPIWLETALKRFRRSTLQIKEIVIPLNDYEAELPKDFKYVRELWLCTSNKNVVQAPTSLYYQKDCRVTRIDDKCNECFDQNSTVPSLPCNPCDKQYIVTHKVTNQVILKYHFSHLLTPGNLSVNEYCGELCPNINATSKFTFDIKDCKLITNFCDGLLHLIYYTESYDDKDNQLIPEDIRIQNYLRSFFYYKIYEFLSHQVIDDSYRVIKDHMLYYKQECDENYVIADIELKKKTIYDIKRDIIKERLRYRKYNIR